MEPLCTQIQLTNTRSALKGRHLPTRGVSPGYKKYRPTRGVSPGYKNQGVSPGCKKGTPPGLGKWLLLWLTLLLTASAQAQSPVQLLDEARQRRSEGALQQALALAGQALRAQESATGADSPETAEIHEFFGETFGQTGNFPFALAKLRQALAIREKHLDSLDVDIANCHLLIGNTLLAAGRTEEAQSAFERSLQLLLLRPDDQRGNLANLYNNLAFSLENTDPERCVQYHHSALALRRDFGGDTNPETGVSYMNLGSVYWRRNQLDSAEFYSREAVRILSLHAPEGKNHNLGKALGNLGLVFGSTGRLDSAAAYYQRSAEVLRVVLGDYHPDVAQTFCNLAIDTRGDVLKSRAYLRVALDILERSEFDTRGMRVDVYANLAENHSHAGEHEQAHYWGKKGLELQQAISRAPNYTLGVLLNNLGNYHSNLGNFETALDYFRQALAVRLVADKSGVPQSLQNIAVCFFHQRRLDSALVYFTAMMDRRPSSLQAHVLPASGMVGLASTCLLLGKDSLALAWVHQAWASLKSKPDSEYLGDKLILLNTLGGVYLFRYKRHAQFADLEMARQYFRQGMALAQHFTFQQAEYADLAAMIQWIYQIAENGIRAEFHAFQRTGDPAAPANAWEYSEQTKAIVLHNTLLESRATRFSGLPDSLAQALDQAKQRLFWLEKRQLERAAKPGTSDSLDLRYAAEALAARTRLNDLRNAVETRYPEYYRLRYGGQRARLLPETIADLPRDQTLVAYFTGDSSVFAFVVNTTGTRLIELKKDFPLDAWVEQLREGIYGYYALPEAERTPDLYRRTTGQYLEFSRKLYQKLVRPLQPWLGPRVVFVPDAALAAIPFEVLPTDTMGSAKNFGALPYLCRRHAISYGYSATTLHNMQTRQHAQEPASRLLVMAPFASTDSVVWASGGEGNRPGFAPLPRSGDEAETVRRIFGGDALLGAAATAPAFLERCGAYRMLHLATHAQADPRRADRACLAFVAPADSAEAGLLFTTDLYGLRLNADLVVLSACETGIGKIQRGEGAISLGRAFAAAGAKSIVHSLWVANDASTTRLMDGFYSALFRGATKDEALQQAKLAYLSTAAPSRQHPFFWAGFIATGAMQPVR
ncbi:MAG: CHAT domain-containing protein [Saprospiraceae bacterium]|nr:CHAT domain-containing protein [Saprospiraceae bacterium]